MIKKETTQIAANILAILILAAGLISPLTPSEGTPSLIELLIFAFVPLIILGTLLLRLENKMTKLFVAFELIAMSVVLFKVLGVVYKHSK
ncbi:MAG: hypothetical protein EPN22_13290 [Nitrospirae bacterium]|nr:MAG: hypothetical protein EPN22_13290 [Nitrospirota bacterium]